MSDGVILDGCQQAAVDAASSGGHVHVVGGPGTGKTTVALAAMTEAQRRLANVVHEHWAPALV